MSTRVKRFKLLGFDGVGSNGGGFEFAVNESLEVFCISDLA